MSSWIREKAFVEDKFLEQLKSLGWKILTIEDNENKNRTKKALLGRNSFKDVILEDILSKSLSKNKWFLAKRRTNKRSYLKPKKYKSFNTF